MNREVRYQCKICNYVLKPKTQDPVPSYCPNCALHNQKGKMVPVSETTGYDARSEKEMLKK